MIVRCISIVLLSLLCKDGFATLQSVDSTKHPPITFEERLFWDINHISDTTKFVDGFMLAASDALLPIAIATPISMFAYGMIEHDPAVAYDAIAIGAGTATTILFQELVVKPIVRRERPYKSLENVRWIDSAAKGFSFPSSHSAISFGLATALSLRYPKWYVIAPSTLYALIVTLSRPYLGVHYPGDIFTGAVLGSLIQFLAFRLERSYPTPGIINDAVGAGTIISFSIPIQ